MTNWWFYIKLVFPVTTWPLRITRTCYSLQFAGKLHEHAISGSNCSHLLCFANIFTCLAESQKSPSRPHSRLHLSYQNYLQFMSKICCLIIFISVPGRIMPLYLFTQMVSVHRQACMALFTYFIINYLAFFSMYCIIPGPTFPYPGTVHRNWNDMDFNKL